MNEEISNIVAEDIPDIAFANQILGILEQRFPDDLFRLSYNESTFGIIIDVANEIMTTEDERRLLCARAAAFAEGLIAAIQEGIDGLRKPTLPNPDHIINNLAGQIALQKGGDWSRIVDAILWASGNKDIADRLPQPIIIRHNGFDVDVVGTQHAVSCAMSALNEITHYRKCVSSIQGAIAHLESQ